MLNIAYRYACEWRFTFNANKSYVLTYGMNGLANESDSLMFKLGNVQIPQAESCLH